MVGNTLDGDGRVDLNDFKKGAGLNAHQAKRMALINRLLDRIHAPGAGLDYGCGLGDVAYRISHRFESIVGVDVTPERVEWANKEYSPVKYYPCTESELAFPDDSFDSVLSSVVINWASDPDNYVGNIHRVLKTNGHLILLVKGFQDLRLFWKRLTRSEANGRLFNLSEMSSFLEARGFEILEVDCYYDPIQDIGVSFKNVLMEALLLPMRLLRAPGNAHYYGILARKVR